MEKRETQSLPLSERGKNEKREKILKIEAGTEEELH